jgi:predicted metalloprotease
MMFEATSRVVGSSVNARFSFPHTASSANDNHGQQKQSFLDQGDIDQALQTASAIGDDRLQRETQGYVVPDGFTHGTSAQRKRWFLNGFNSGKISDCNTFSVNSLN